ncbi:LysR family transcriptional regulator [Imtechella halotolerans]|uniref:LysR family transcriptional regulator n=1 Tax=Imtechella halotolerans K1 TaxID=946077 RepID=I0WBU6_9FLAO|nr:LysR family transcriptional regulator [Imtechella halotolerans]EID73862.1 LysR family transcriptional regulator [Imtechella halotolerans K1]WMQ64073.1 LysR family transcriptional regulator [Imtechella halotolerans]
MKTKLHIFKTVAKHLSFTKAAELLHISQPAISKTIKNLEQEYETTFFVRKRNSIELTEEGKSFLIYVNKIVAIYSEIDEQFLHKNESFPEFIKFGVSTTLSNYIIPKVIAKFRMQFPPTKFDIISDNSENIENLILNEEIDFGITEGNSSNPKLNFEKFIKDEIVLVTNVNNPSFKKGSIDIETLQKIPIIEREKGSGTREIIDAFLVENGIDNLNGVVTLNSTEAIKNYLYNSTDYALLSINAINDDLIDNKLKIVDIKGLSIERWFYFVKRTGYLSNSMEKFKKFILLNYNF